MRFVTFQRAAYPETGVITGDEIISLREAGFEDMLSVIRRGADGLDAIRGWCGRPPAGAQARLGEVKLLAPIPRPPKVVCVGLNYLDHARESNLKVPDVPTIFAKFSTAITGPGSPIVLPKASTRPDYEAEFAFIIGRGGRYIPGARWREHVFGYTCFNDVSARDFQMATTQWVIGKSFDTFAPMGPCIVTADEVPDPHALDISLTLGRRADAKLQHVQPDFQDPGPDRAPLGRLARWSRATSSLPAPPGVWVSPASRHATCVPATKW